MTSRSKRPPLRLVLTCEHADHRIPRAYASLFAGAEEVLLSHQGWDPGAFSLARRMARRLEQPLLATRWCRLLVESNRSPTNPRIWSRYTKGLPAEERERILERYWRPHRQAVQERIAAALARGERVAHVAVHSFTPVMGGIVRNADVGLLFDSRRKHESADSVIFTRKVGHTQRGGRPIKFDRFFAAQLGGKAVDLIVENKNNHIATLQWSRAGGFQLDSLPANKLRDQWKRIHPRRVHPSLYDPLRFQPSRLGKEYLMTMLTNAIGNDDVEQLRSEMFAPGKLSTRYQSVNIDMRRRIETLK